MCSHKAWNIEMNPTKGHRATVKLWPTGHHRVQRYRMLRGTWFNTGNRDRNYYLSQMDLQKRIAELEASWDANAYAHTVTCNHSRET